MNNVAKPCISGLSEFVFGLSHNDAIAMDVVEGYRVAASFTKWLTTFCGPTSTTQWQLPSDSKARAARKKRTACRA